MFVADNVWNGPGETTGGSASRIEYLRTKGELYRLLITALRQV